MPEIVTLEPEQASFLENPPPFLSQCAIAVSGRVVPLSSKRGRAILNSYAQKVLLEEVEAIGALEVDQVTGLLLWKTLRWDSEVLGRNLAIVALACGQYLRELFDLWKERALAKEVEYATIRIASWYREKKRKANGAAVKRELHAARLDNALVDAGFRFLEEIVLFEKKLEPQNEREKLAEKISIGVPFDTDFREIAEIAASSYIYDRFHGDNYFSKEEADRIHRRWALDSVSGRADVVIAAKEASGSLLGYATAILDKDEREVGWIDMLAVKKDRKREGIGEALLSSMCHQLALRGVNVVTLGTQSTNKPAVALYQKRGFEPTGALKTYRIVLRGG